MLMARCVRSVGSCQPTSPGSTLICTRSPVSRYSIFQPLSLQDNGDAVKRIDMPWQHIGRAELEAPHQRRSRLEEDFLLHVDFRW